MKILYVGDIMGRPGVDVVAKVLPDLIQEYAVDFVIAQGENVTEGRGMSIEDMQELQSYGVDFFTGGNWSLFREGVLTDEHPVIRPANYPDGTPGVGYKRVTYATGSVLVVTLLGKIVGKDAGKPIKNPLQTIDEILETADKSDAIVVNFHGDYSSEKRVIGYYLDGRVSAVIGDHWHVPTADAMVLPKGTAHITDVGMCGTLHSSLGVKTDTIITRWRDGLVNKNELETEGPMQFNAVLVNTVDGLASDISHIQTIFE
ncbi:YmdB family metallophosphoesterase [Candidatus Saccharibacteria bacterium]|nr:YmdB family metallophosphoesterase [Candidatus Saccharibacteria bacterium]